MFKVYCKNCNFFRKQNDYFLGSGGFMSYYCKYFTNLDLSSDINYNTGCRLYKRKWWKFWVK